jgi:predicted RNA binding protein YcfA (HicA-like mRNA interferase family)
MPKLPAITPRKIIAVLKRNGFILDHATGSHYIFYHLQKQSIVTIPYHNKDLPKGTLLAILKQAGLNREKLN